MIKKSCKYWNKLYLIWYVLFFKNTLKICDGRDNYYFRNILRNLCNVALLKLNLVLITFLKFKK
ncbi:hypothetical protein BpHYR1_001655 [Brachionus plicatilis]|uniref:Uncharacterized protein n=1 Tax=Brachionus plicatilis TaxID=10195 RepID=A0A3M7SY56_BRAPC|nr:hypothetical protein BpHYR1_001655 [Brachionus plicatilis]